MADYTDLPTLRQELVSDDPDDRVDAYMAVRNAGLDPEEVLDDDPPAEELREAGVIEPAPEHRTNDERLEEILAEVREIRALVGGGD